MHNKVSEFVYQPHETVNGYAIKKEKFLKIISDPTGQKIRPNIKKRYINDIRIPVNKHREVTAGKFASRIDYVDLTAFGIGIEKIDDTDHFAQEAKMIE
jgi:hypothetical protein